MSQVIAAISTPAGPGAVGIVRLSGEGCRQVADRLFRSVTPGKTLSGLRGYTGCLGRTFDDQGEIDEAVAYVYEAPRSYTGEEVVELCCHGSGYLLGRVLEACLRQGARLAEPGEFTKRAFLNGKMSLDEAESVMDIIGSTSAQAARAALSARDGALFREISACADRLLDLAAHLAAWVDYPEEDLPQVEDGQLEQDLRETKERLDKLVSGYRTGRMVREGVDTVLAGRPNVGKSTLMNLLAGSRRSIVTDIPGTTRDVVEDTVRLGDMVLRLSDTAGLRHSDDPIEQAGVELTNQRLESCDLVLALFDSASPLGPDDLELLERLRGRLCVAVLNKADLPAAADRRTIEEYIPHVVSLSAKNGEGVEELARQVEELLGTAHLEPGAPMLATQRQLECVRRALGALEDTLEALAMGQTYDALSVCIDEAIDALLELTGQRATTAVVDRVFHNFCVGK